MAYDSEQLFISDDFIIELMGWKEVDFLGPFGGSRGLKEQKELRENGLKLLRIGPIFLQRLTGSLYYNSFFQDKFVNRSTKKIPLASSALRHLVLEADKFNNTAKNVVVLDKLKEAGNPVQFSDREKVIGAVKLTRKDIVRAIKTERILRENPNFRPEKFSDNISALKAMQISDKANSYGKYFDETMQVAVSIQDELKRLLNN
ncbi:hypothetical protein [Okeania sp. SIO2B3]|uniref:hypothetical protein n=1 Tax=Okeania sp. SIO2B3 TaxID=2607784 RepID=UPI0013C14C69|nr:hypothetical protein [Okeania sp. SIO2B3]NET45131.1 hypothetical protein [Okeania sp. SIO2B3]